MANSKVSPHNEEAEQSVLGAILIDKDAIGLVSETISPKDFYNDINGIIYDAMLSLYEDRTADSLIETLRTDFDSDKRQQELEALHSVIKADQPAIFLFSPYYLYISSKSLRGFDENYLPLPGDRFTNIKDWYIRTVRIFK